MLIDWFTVAAQAVNFLLLVWLLKRFLYKPVLAALDAREKGIAQQLQDAAAKKAEAATEQADFQNKNKEFEEKRAALLLGATQAAESERKKLLETVRSDAEALRAKLQKNAAEEFGTLNQKIATLAQQEVFAIARKALSDLANVDLEERMANLFIHRIQGLDDKQREELNARLNSSSSQSALVRSAFGLSSEQKAAIGEALKPLLGAGGGIIFETKPDLIGGIELSANGHKIAWNIADYLTGLIGSMRELLEPKPVPLPLPTASAPLPHVA